MKQRILQINKFLYIRGGAETYMFQLSEALQKNNFEIEFWGMEDDKNIVEDKYNCFAKNINYQEISTTSKIRASLNTIYSNDNKKKIRIILDKFNPDIVHLHNFNYQLTPSILPEIKKRNIKIVYTSHDCQFACPYHRFYNFQQNKSCDKCKTGKFYSCITNRCFDGSILRSLIGTIESYYYHTFNYYNKYIDAIISPSSFLANMLKHVYEKKIHVIPNFINLQASTAIKDTEKQDYILYFGRISKEKGIINILETFMELKIKLIIVGNGPETDEINNNEYIQHLGPKYGDELLKLIREAKFVIQPSIGWENCPMTVIESFACGTPVIAPNHSGFQELIEHKYNGFLLDFSSENITNELNEIFQLDIKTLNHNCIETFNKRFTPKVHLEKVLELYKLILN